MFSANDIVDKTFELELWVFEFLTKLSIATTLFV